MIAKQLELGLVIEEELDSKEGLFFFIYGQDNRAAYIKHSESEFVYPVCGVTGRMPFYVVADNLIDWWHPYRIGQHRIKISPFKTSYLKQEEYYALWVLENNTAVIERVRQPDTYVSELWELRPAAKRLGLELILC